MGLWEAIVLIVFIGVVSEMYRARLKSRSTTAEQADQLGELNARLARLEERMANVESIVLESEKKRAFDARLEG